MQQLLKHSHHCIPEFGNLECFLTNIFLIVYSSFIWTPVLIKIILELIRKLPLNLSCMDQIFNSKAYFVLHLDVSSFIRTNSSLTLCCQKKPKIIHHTERKKKFKCSTFKEIVTLVTITHVVNACMCCPNQRNIPAEPEKVFLGYHLQC